MSTPYEDEFFEDQMRNLLIAARIAEGRDRPDRHDIGDACRWAESRLRHYRDKEAIDDEIATEVDPT